MRIKGVFAPFSASFKLFLFLFIILFSFFVTLLVAFFFVDTNIDYNNLSSLSSQTVFKQKILQGIQTFGLFILPSLLGFYFFTKERFLAFFISKKTSLITYVLIFFLVFLSVPFMNALGYFNSLLPLPEALHWMVESEEKAKVMTQFFLQADTLNDLMLNLLIIAFIPALGEELLFRGILQKMLYGIRKNQHFAIWLTAFVFSAVHFQFLTFLPRFLLGAMLGYLMVWSGNILLPIFAHFTNNALAVILSYGIQHGWINSNIEHIGTSSKYWYFALISAGLSVFLFYLIYQKIGKRSV